VTIIEIEIVNAEKNVSQNQKVSSLDLCTTSIPIAFDKTIADAD
jgi:hypothetical protein